MSNEEEKTGSPYVVGIDLGTTNCAVAYVDAELEEGDEGYGQVEVFEIPQLVRAGTVKAQRLLPSFLYLPGEHEVSEAAAALPFEAPEGTIVGAWARDQGAKVPHRLVSSAKSWLCHPGIDRRGAVLPWEADGEEVAKVSPLEAQTRLLRYIRAAWDSVMAADEPAYALAEQEVFLTVPASFDPTARELTVEAARAAGLERVTLLEEPQAAFYAWLEQQGDTWRERLSVGDLVLVLDVGGGTTDLTLIAVREAEGNLVLERVAVGDHLLLGGDNMDLALAHVVATRLGEKGKKLNAWQSRALWLACRAAKETLLSKDKASAPVSVLGRGSKLIGGTLKTELLREDIEKVVFQGFFPACSAEDRPTQRGGAGLAEIGLPFAADAAITRHVAAFLAAQDAEDGTVDGFAYPSALLFNGGVFKGQPMRDAAVKVIDSWLKKAKRDPVEVLAGEDLDLAVARGAAYYGNVRRGRGVRIRGGLGRTYYVGIESSLPAVPGMPAPVKALCAAPFGLEEGSTVDVGDREFSLLVGRPAQFRFFGSTTRKDDEPGDLLDSWEEGELEELSSLEVTLDPGEGLRPGSVIPVTLQATATEVGTLEVHCVARDGRRFKLEWNVREEGE
ncbi:MAG: Hsp70 family protein [Planctomycetota bacterium]|nr:MAG: Hsp70 family protein [Planctomycetota bacterium]